MLHRGRFAYPIFTAASVVLALATVLLTLLFVAVVLVATAEGLTMEGTRTVNVVSTVAEALLRGELTDESAPVPYWSRRDACRFFRGDR